MKVLKIAAIVVLVYALILMRVLGVTGGRKPGKE